MPVMQPPMGPIEITDPNNVPDVLINGPFNVMNTGGWSTSPLRMCDRTTVISSAAKILQDCAELWPVVC
jgi:hypothetical protein